ncbi:MAG: DUF4380 domain-containing protein [Acidobacteriota bacterium]|nr:DUF4380 domain-containing protein [Acidobacteriota bacterium]
MEKIQFQNFQNCIRLSNDEIEIFVATEFGPRIIGYNFIGGENVLGIHTDAKVETTLGVWKPYGGHRLWIAPENMPNSYAPDNSPVEHFFDEQNNTIRLVQSVETVTNTQKEMTIMLDEKGSGVSINHKITNLNERDIEIAAWALTIMREGGEVFIPNEPFAAYGATTLLPIRNLTVWSYTDFSDSRWQFDSEFIRLRVDSLKTAPQKIGVLNKQGWIEYKLEDVIFTKRFRFQPGAIYPDMNSNTEIYTAGSFIEIETLAPVVRLAPGESTEHIEVWQLTKSNNQST